MTRRLRPAAAGSLLLALIFGLGFGLNFGVSNENTYLLGGLRLLHPQVLAEDWFASQTTVYHRLFAYPVAALLYLDPSGRAFAIVNVLLLAAGALVVYKLTGLIGPTSPGKRVLAFAFVLLAALATRTVSVADSTLYTLAFEPATVGATGFLLGLYLFARGRYLLSGAALAVSGLLHANYLVLSLPVFLLAHLFTRCAVDGNGKTRHKRLPWTLALQFALPLVALAALVPIIIPIALHPGGAGTGILLSIRSPHHYQPPAFRDQFVPFLGWLLLLVAGLRRNELTQKGLSPVVALAAGMSVLIVLATALTTFVYVPSVAQAYVWRLAPFVVLLAQLYALRMVVGEESAPAGPGHPALGSRRDWLFPAGWRALAVVVACECFVYYYYLRHRDRLVLEVLSGILLLGLLTWAADRSKSRAAAQAGASATARADAQAAQGAGNGAFDRPAEHRPRTCLARMAAVVAPTTPLALIAGALLGLVAAGGLTDRSNLFGAPPPEAQLYTWARTTTHRDSIFLIPPDMDDFRLSSQRAVVVDWKSTPFVPDELEEWYRRIDAVSGQLHPRTAAQAATGYGRSSAEWLTDLAGMYRASYAVFRQPLESAPPSSWRLVFANERYAVFRTLVGAAGDRRGRPGTPRQPVRASIPRPAPGCPCTRPPNV